MHARNAAVIRAVVFDIGGVVCTFDPGRRLQALATRTGLDEARIHRAIWESGLDGRAEAGELSEAETERVLIDALDGRIDASGLRRAWATAFPVDREVLGLVMALRRPAYAFTNNGPMFSICLAHELVPLAHVFERVICSWEVRARKPETVAFARLCRETGQVAEELFFVDDSPDNVESGRAAGFTAIRFTSAPELAEDLRRRHLTG